MATYARMERLPDGSTEITVWGVTSPGKEKFLNQYLDEFLPGLLNTDLLTMRQVVTTDEPLRVLADLSSRLDVAENG